VRNAILAALALLAVVCLLPRVGLAWEHPDGNLRTFQDYGERIAHGAVPYRDVAVEYPPGALPAIVLPALLPWSYATSFKLLAALVAALTIVLVACLLERLGASRRATLLGTAFVPVALLAFGGTALQRFDLLPAALTVLALFALLGARPRLALAALAAGALVKLYPLALAPLALAYVWRRQGRRELVACAAVTAVVCLAVLAPFAAFAHVGLYNSFAQQANRHLQLETIGASGLLAAHAAGAYEPRVVFDGGAYTLAGRAPDALARVHTLLQALALVAIWVLFARRPRPAAGELVAASTAAVAAFAVLGKAFSPQYLLWLVPLVPAVGAVAAAALLLAALALSHVIYPTLYEELKRLEPGATWTLVARNALVLILLVVLAAGARATRRSRPAAGSGAAAPTRSR
jgi:uncharacterized membrane protein